MTFLPLDGWFRSAALAAALLLGAASLRAEDPPPAPAADEEPVYVYNGSSRDPLIPLVGAAQASIGTQPDREPGAFNPSSMELKGILRTRTGRWAMMTGTAGERYVVENGKIHDGKKKPVEGYVGIIKEKTVVLIGPNNQVTELKLKRDQEESKQP